MFDHLGVQQRVVGGRDDEGIGILKGSHRLEDAGRGARPAGQQRELEPSGAPGQGVAVCLGGANLERYGDPADGTALAERVDDAQHHRHAGDGRPAFLANPGGLGDRIFAAPLARQDQGGEGPAVFRVEPAGHVSSFSYTR
jgi:hypothetical protein